MKKKVSDSKCIMGSYETRTRDEVVRAMDEAMLALPEVSRDCARFEVVLEREPYDPTAQAYASLHMTFERTETDEEEACRGKNEARLRELIESRDRADYERLNKKFGAMGQAKRS